MKTVTKRKLKPVDVNTLVKKGEDIYIPVDFKENHAYFSKPDGTGAYHGVTTILRVIAKPALIQWAANMACDHILVNSKINPLYEAERHVHEDVIEQARTAHTKKKEKAGEQGSDVHEQIEIAVKEAIRLSDGYIHPHLVSVSDQVNKFYEWARTNNVRFLESERVLYSKELHVAGTADIVCEINGKRFIGDVKTSSGIYPEAFIQTSAYARMAMEMGLYDKFDGVIIINLPKTGGITVKENYDIDGNFLCFVACLTIYKQMNAIK